MLKINLLPLERQKTEFPMWKVYRAGSYLFLVLALLTWAYNLGMYKYLNYQTGKVDKQITEMAVWQERYDKAQAQNADIANREGIINKLNKDRISWGHFLAEMGNITPSGCWLDNVRQTTSKEGDVLVIKGGARTMDNVLEYSGSLQGLPNVTAVMLQETTQAEKNKIKYVQFTIQVQRKGVAHK